MEGAEKELERGVSSLWTSVNHIALVVSDVGRSLTFYTDVVGMTQVLRPNFDRSDNKAICRYFCTSFQLQPMKTLQAWSLADFWQY